MSFCLKCMSLFYFLAFLFFSASLFRKHCQSGIHVLKIPTRRNKNSNEIIILCVLVYLNSYTGLLITRLQSVCLLTAVRNNASNNWKVMLHSLKLNYHVLTYFCLNVFTCMPTIDAQQVKISGEFTGDGRFPFVRLKCSGKWNKIILIKITTDELVSFSSKFYTHFTSSLIAAIFTKVAACFSGMLWPRHICCTSYCCHFS